MKGVQYSWDLVNPVSSNPEIVIWKYFHFPGDQIQLLDNGKTHNQGTGNSSVCINKVPLYLYAIVYTCTFSRSFVKITGQVEQGHTTPRL